MATTYEAIATVTVGSGGAANIEFTSIPATHTDLVIKLSARQSGTSGSMGVTFNDSTSGYSYRELSGNGSTAASASGTSQASINTGSANVNWSTSTASTFSNYEIYIPNYTGSNNKSVSIDVVVENNATLGYNVLQAGLWANTAAITKVTLDPNGAETFAQYSTATLYGIKNS